jgi:DNA-binding LacI/PurR family transcriptional regulator
MEKIQNISSKDVAREAGVSQATVSYVLNDVPGIKIKPETRQAVLAAAKKLNYYPNLNAKSMRLKKSMSIAVVSDKDVANYGFIRVLEGVKDAVVPHNYSLTFSFSKPQEGDQTEYVQYFISNRVDGIIFALANPPEEHCAYLAAEKIPFVIIHPQSQSERLNLVKNDMNGALFEAIQMLYTKGCNKIGFIGTGVGNVKDRRWASFQQIMKQIALPIDEAFLGKTPGIEDEVEGSIDQFIEKCIELPNAIVCETPGTAFRLFRCLARRGIQVPDQIAVVAIGTSRFSHLTYPALSTVESPLYEMGFSGAEMLLNVIAGNPYKNLPAFEWTFVPRES